MKKFVERNISVSWKMSVKCYHSVRLKDTKLSTEFNTCWKLSIHCERKRESFLHLFNNCWKRITSIRFPFLFVEENTNQDEMLVLITLPLSACRVLRHMTIKPQHCVVLVEPKDVRSYLDEIAATVNQARPRACGTLYAARECGELHSCSLCSNLHPIMDNGNTIRFSDQGPGIKEKTELFWV